MNRRQVSGIEIDKQNKKAWQDHKRECKCLKSCKPRYPPDSVRLLGRVVIKLMEETPSESEKLYSFYDLESNINKLTEDKREGLRQLAMTFQHFMREEIQDASQLPPSFDIFEAFAKGLSTGLPGGMDLAATFIQQ
ncbi:SET and MYND domain-containing protein 3 [Fukomys damarensis]|uniref:SET and MYND domain-containing protein 3 n=1 Tax=Fukomys damarensis TaxID=885580 RepID=A0A091D5C0_FUKDA|nr:SET and MYND domain-containing protein 3 [Fukomys damarensis]